MSLQRLAARPSHSINTASSPNLSLAASTALARKASLNALTAGQDTTMVGADGREIEVGDTVDVPGGMHGVVKFIGGVRGKKGTFAGVELAKEYASRGKNGGDVEGVRYFTTSVPGSGIFLPIHRAARRASPTPSADTFPPTPTTPSFFGGIEGNSASPPHAIPKFSQSLGPGARPPSPQFKPKARPSLPRPESPYRNKPMLHPTPGRGPSMGTFGNGSLSKSQIGTPRFTPSPAPKASIFTKPKTPNMQLADNSRLGTAPNADDSAETTPAGFARSSDGSGAGSHLSSGSGFTPITRRSMDDAQDEIKRLKRKLEERDKQLKEQASSLADMEASLQELQSLIPMDGSTHARNRSAGSYDDADSAQLRAIIREKNEKIAMLTAEFDAHRADFRSTIDTLEMASTETERVYEKKVEELMQEIRELQDRGEDVESVARQLKQLEDLVQELEEGLEEARRGEADARGEAEFLRGEVERTKAELQVEREKAKEAVKSARTVSPINVRDSRDIEQRDDEIRGLKAIIHSLSSASGTDMSTSTIGGTRPTLQRSQTTPNDQDTQAQIERLERERKDLQALIDRKNNREEELERELEQLRTINSRHMSVTSNGYSDRTTTQEKRSSGRDSKGTVVNWRNSALHRKDSVPLAHVTETESASGTSTSGVLWCEICESNGHDILTCPNVDKSADTGPSCSISSSSISNKPAEASSLSADDTPMQTRVHGHNITSSSPPNSQDPDMPKPLSMGGRRTTPANNTTILGAPPSAPPTAPLPSPYDASLVAGKDGSKPDPNKWCALCERDGHDSINCAFEDQF